MIEGIWVLVATGVLNPQSAMLYTAKADCEKQAALLNGFDAHSKYVCVPTYADPEQLKRLFAFPSAKGTEP
jgi:hypothetical protein